MPILVDRSERDSTITHAFVQCGAYSKAKGKIKAKRTNTSFAVLWGIDPDEFKKKLRRFIEKLVYEKNRESN